MALEFEETRRQVLQLINSIVPLVSRKQQLIDLQAEVADALADAVLEYGEMAGEEDSDSSDNDNKRKAQNKNTLTLT